MDSLENAYLGLILAYIFSFYIYFIVFLYIFMPLSAKLNWRVSPHKLSSADWRVLSVAVH